MTTPLAINDDGKAVCSETRGPERRCNPGPGNNGVPVASAEQNHDDEENPEDINLVTWESPNEPLNPKNWSTYRKWSITLTMSAVGFVSIMSASTMAPALSSIARELHMNNVESEMALSVYILAIAFGPLVLGPLPEVYGRLILLHFGNVWLLAWNVVCGLANSKALLIAARFLAGFGGSLVDAIDAGVLSDVWRAEQRGRSLGLYNLVPLLGTAVGPTVGGYITAHLQWRWVFWIMAIAQAILILASLASFRETHEPTLLGRKAARMRRATGNQDLCTTFERLDQGRTVPGVLRRSLLRSIRLLLTHSIIQLVSLIFAFNFGVLLLVVSTFAEVWTIKYKESVATSGLHYIALVIGELTGATIGAPLIDRVWRHLRDRSNGTVAPEYRVPLMLPGAFLVPIGLLWYGWAAQAQTFWIVPDLGVAILGCGLMSATQAMQAYITDAYPDHTASAIAASSFLRSIFGFTFPVFAPTLYQSLGYGWGNSLLAFIAVTLSIAGPAIL